MAAHPFRYLFVAVGLSLATGFASYAQQSDAEQSARATAAIDMTGYWVSVVTEDWKFRMVTPARGVYNGIPVNSEGRRSADGWNPARDESADEQCRSYGAAAIMRVPGRLHITWENDNTLRVDTDAGSQTRLFHFDAATAPGRESTWQGHAVAQWQHAAATGQAPERNRARTGNLKVVTTNMRPGYVRKNGVPYSENAVLTEYYNRHSAPNGDQWLVVTTVVEDPQYFNRPYVTSSHFKKLPDDSGWNPTPCSAS